MTSTTPAKSEAQTKHGSTCLFNIIIYVESIEEAQNFQKYLDLLKKKFPCRGIFIFEDIHKKEDSLALFLNNKPVDSIKSLDACDQVSINFSGAARERVPFLILNYLLGDIPLYVIWEQDPSKKNLIFDHIQEIATKIVFDSNLTSDIREYSRHMLEFAETKKFGVTDFSWFSIGAWRELLSSLFNSPKRIDDLFHAKLIRITYNTTKEPIERDEIPSIYLQGWIAAALSWKIKDVEIIEGHMRIEYERFIHDTVILLIPEVTDNASSSGTIASIEIDSGKRFHCLLKKAEKANIVKLWITTEDSCEIPTQFTLSEPTKEQLVLNELFWRQTSNHYKNMLRLLNQTRWNDAL